MAASHFIPFYLNCIIIGDKGIMCGECGKVYSIFYLMILMNIFIRLRSWALSICMDAKTIVVFKGVYVDTYF